MEEELQQAAPAKKKKEPRLNIQPQTFGELLFQFKIERRVSPAWLVIALILVVAAVAWWWVRDREPVYVHDDSISIYGILTFLALLGVAGSLQWKTVHRVFWRLLEESGMAPGEPGKPYPNPTGLPKVDIRPQGLAERWIQYRANASRSLTWPMLYLVVAMTLCVLWDLGSEAGEFFVSYRVWFPLYFVWLVRRMYRAYFERNIVRRLVEARDAAAASEAEKASAGEGQA